MPRTMKGNTYLFDIQRDDLHRLLGGGLPKGTMVLIMGKVGTGKSVVSQRLAYGLLSHSYKLTFISTEMTTKGFIDQMDSLNYPIKDEIHARNISFIPVFPLIGNAKPRGDFLQRLATSEGLFESDLIFVDTFSSLVKHDIDEESAYEILSLFKKLAGQGKTIVLTVDPDDLSQGILGPFKSVCDILLELKTVIVEGNIDHLMYITRFGTAGSHVADSLGFRIVAGAGFIVDITLVA